MKVTPLKIAIHADDSNAVFGYQRIHIELLDEAAGAFFKVSPQGDKPQESGVIELTLEELEIVLIEARKMQQMYIENGNEN